MLTKVFRIIHQQPLILVVAVALILFALFNQPPKKRVYQWELESQQLLQRSNQFSDLVSPKKR